MGEEHFTKLSKVIELLCVVVLVAIVLRLMAGPVDGMERALIVVLGLAVASVAITSRVLDLCEPSRPDTLEPLQSAWAPSTSFDFQATYMGGFAAGRETQQQESYKEGFRQGFEAGQRHGRGHGPVRTSRNRTRRRRRSSN